MGPEIESDTSLPPLKEPRLHHQTLGIELTGVATGDGSVSGYRGIPYGKLEKRWTRASAFTHRPDSQFDAREHGPKCPQPSGSNSTKDYGPHIPFPDVLEDDLECLNLNIYCPVRSATEPLPVFVWIHGGSLCFGAGSDPIWDPAYLVQESIRLGKPIVAVAINYRLGPFGFLAPKDPNDPTVEQGNFGFHDQYLALQWVQKHIAGFKGDPSRVTVGGESAGGCSVHAQIALQARATEKLFNRAIMQSGNLAVMGFCDRPRMDELWHRGLVEAGVESADDPLEDMRGLTAEQIRSNSALNLDGYPVFLDDVFVTRPLVADDGQFITHSHCIDAVLHGDNADEGNYFRADAQKPDALYKLKQAATEMYGSEWCARLLDMYGLSEDLEPAELGNRLHRLPEDVRFYLPSNELQRAWPNAAFYHFTAQSPFNTSAWPGDSFHTLELLHLFGNFDHFLSAEGMTDHVRLGQEMRNVWVDFVHGRDLWEGSFQGKAMTFVMDEMRSQSFDECRGWPEDRRLRLKALQALGVARVTQLATLLYP